MNDNDTLEAIRRMHTEHQANIRLLRALIATYPDRAALARAWQAEPEQTQARHPLAPRGVMERMQPYAQTVNREWERRMGIAPPAPPTTPISD